MSCVSIQLPTWELGMSLSGTSGRVQVVHTSLKAILESSQCLSIAVPGSKDLGLLCSPLTSVGQELKQEQEGAEECLTCPSWSAGL